MSRPLRSVLVLVLLAACGSEDRLNHAPTILPLTDRTAAVGKPMAATIVATDPDQDRVTLALLTAPAGATLTGSALAWTPEPADLGTHGFVVAATDDGDPRLSDYASFAVTVLDPDFPRSNHAPVLDPVPDQRIAVGAQLVITLTGADPDGDTLRFEALLAPSGAELDPVTGRFAWSPGASDAGAHFAAFRAVDDGVPPLEARGLVRIDVDLPSSINLPPLFLSTAVPTVAEPCVPTSIELLALDPEDTALQFSSPNLPPGATLTEEHGAAVFRWTPGSPDSGVHVVGVYATDQGEPPLSDAVALTVIVPELPPLAIEPVAPAVAPGGATAVLNVTFPHRACYAATASTALPATWDAAAGTLTWRTAVDDFGLYDVEIQLTDLSRPDATDHELGRYVVQYADSMDAFAGYAIHQVNLDWCCAGSVVYGADGGVVHASTDYVTDVHGYAYRVLDWLQTPFAAVDYELTAYDSVVGPACGSGGLLGLYNVAVTDAAVAWPSWGNELPPTVAIGVPDSPLALIRGTASLGGPTTGLTVALQHSDNSNICSVDVYWDEVVLTPVAP